MSIYLDWNATTPPLPSVLEAMDRAGRDAWGNPSSVHAVGSRARKLVEDARDAVARLCRRHAREVVFTSGGTEANNLALGWVTGAGALLITSRLEHPSIAKVAERLGARGVAVHWLGVGPEGRVDPGEVDAVLAQRGAGGRVLVAVQAANHETGVVQPVAEIIGTAHSRGARVHVDAAQAVGKMDCEAWRDADTIAIAAHKIRGPKGVGALIASACDGLEPLMAGGGQEYGIRPGTVSGTLAAGFGVAADWAIDAPVRYGGVRTLRDRLEAGLLALGGRVNGTAPRLPHVLSVSFEGRRGDEIVAGLDQEGVCVSSGSACSSGAAERSPVIDAMLGAGRASGAVRASLGDATTLEEVEGALAAWARVIGRTGMDEVLLEAMDPSLLVPWKNDA